MAASLTGLNFFIPIAAFLLVFLIVYAILAKTKILGENFFIHILISFVLAIFFIMQVSLVDFVQFSSAWFVVFLVCIFLILVLIGLTHGNIEVIAGNKWVAWILIAGLIVFFIISSAHVFNWAVAWDKVWSWFYTEWFSMILLFVIAGIVAWVLARK